VNAPTKVLSVLVPSRARASSEPLIGAAGIAFLEQLRVDSYAFSGVDARAPMRRDVVRVVRIEDAADDDF